jgi:TorA maturation chaperone TorD
MSEYNPDKATARADLCRFLSACYYEPAIEFVEENLFHSLLVAATQHNPDLTDKARKLGEAFAAHDLQTLLVDYTHLFLGPLQALANPYGSSWLKTPVPTDENPPPAVLSLYSAGGFEMDDEFKELPDHVAVELEFLYLLTFKQSRAEAAGETEQAVATADLRAQFLREHLGAWIGPFSAAVKTHAETEFYRQLADFTERFVRMESV